ISLSFLDHHTSIQRLKTKVLIGLMTCREILHKMKVLIGLMAYLISLIKAGQSETEIAIDGQKLVVANVGDSRAVISFAHQLLIKNQARRGKI
ncbi:unnamed protein product, partial [Brassica oleracea var. botrytis]